jgi:hypothetical protein
MSKEVHLCKQPIRLIHWSFLWPWYSD